LASVTSQQEHSSWSTALTGSGKRGDQISMLNSSRSDNQDSLGHSDVSGYDASVSNPSQLGVQHASQSDIFPDAVHIPKQLPIKVYQKSVQINLKEPLVLAYNGY
jgi:hypothetical protein